MRGREVITNMCFLGLCSIGGALLSLTGMTIGWMIGTLILAGVLSWMKPKVLQPILPEKGIRPGWRSLGQWILGIELGKQISVVVLVTFRDHWLAITLMLLVSILISFLAGFVLWKNSKADLLTSLFGTIPGGMATLPAIANELGANTIVVSVVQLIRIIVVFSSIPLLATYLYAGQATPPAPAQIMSEMGTGLLDPAIAAGIPSFVWTILLAFGAWAGYRAAKLVRLPAPWLVGGMLGVAFAQILIHVYLTPQATFWWPHWLLVLSQIVIGCEVGSRMHASMFVGMKQIVGIGFLTTIGLTAAMVGCAFLVSEVTDISFLTAMLAFAPGGVAEMTTTALVLHADSTFVVTVQTLRIIVSLVVLPPLLRNLVRITRKRQGEYQAKDVKNA